MLDSGKFSFNKKWLNERVKLGKAVVKVPNSYSTCDSVSVFSVQFSLKHRKVSSNMHSYQFRSSNESLHRSHHRLVANLASD
jgi:hypothetical protein